MPSRFSVRVATFLAAMVLCIGTPRAQALFPPDYANLIRQSDLVVHGLVRDVSRDQVPAADLFPDDPRPDATTAIIILEVEVREVLKGYQTEADLTLVVPAGSSGLRTDYNIGNEVVLSAIYWKYMRGGSYMVTNDAGCFRNWKGRWFCQYVLSTHDATEVPMDSIRAAVDRCRPEVVATKAAIVALVTVDDVSDRRPPTRHGRYAAGQRTITARLTDVIKGPTEADVVTFRTMRKSGDNSPSFAAGEQWLIFLGSDNEGLYLFDTTNGAFRVEGDSLIQANRVVVPLTRADLVAKLKAAIGSSR